MNCMEGAFSRKCSFYQAIVIFPSKSKIYKLCWQCNSFFLFTVFRKFTCTLYSKIIRRMSFFIYLISFFIKILVHSTCIYYIQLWSSPPPSPHFITIWTQAAEAVNYCALYLLIFYLSYENICNKPGCATILLHSGNTETLMKFVSKCKIVRKIMLVTFFSYNIISYLNTSVLIYFHNYIQTIFSLKG